ncbi:phosphotransferase enzyme family protein [Hypoxylon sp. FL0890]|nr:phosphotransferase enzyme family protein [Hypoxylon sp. FL0890]
MNESPQEDDQVALPERGETEKAHELANTITMNQLSAKLKRDPSTDLSQLLKQQANVYPQLRVNLAQAAHQRCKPTEKESTSSRDNSHASKGDAHELLLKSPIEITHPLHEKVLMLAGLNGRSSGLASHKANSDIVVGLNQAIENSQLLWSLHGTFVLGLDASKVVKIGTSLDPDGVSNLQYINTHVAEIPTPSFLGALNSGQRSYIFMSRADGVALDTIWPELTVKHKLSIQEQLNDMFRALRAKPFNLHQDDGCTPRIGSFTSGICKDTRRSQRVSKTPIHTEAEFNDFLCHQTGRTVTPWIKMIRSSLGECHRIVMTHGDLHPRNIMVQWESDGNGTDAEGEDRRIRVTSLIDWELSGWYPEYWEFVKALSTISMRGPLADWFEYLPTEAIGSWPVEFSIDSLLDRWLG